MRADLAEVVQNISPIRGCRISSWCRPGRRLRRPGTWGLRAAGVDQFSVSLDFPDRRHDDFRCYPGLYGHLSDVIPRCSAHGFDDIVLNTCVTSANVAEIDAAADQAQAWGVNIATAPIRLADGMSRLLSRVGGAVAGFGGAVRAGGAAAGGVHRERSDNAAGDAAIFRDGRRRLQGGAAIPGSDERRGAAAVLDAVPAISARAAGAHGARVHEVELLRRVLCRDTVESGQELSPAVVGERAEVPGGGVVGPAVVKRIEQG